MEGKGGTPRLRGLGHGADDALDSLMSGGTPPPVRHSVTPTAISGADDSHSPGQALEDGIRARTGAIRVLDEGIRARRTMLRGS
jgi:hypothetical protein